MKELVGKTVNKILISPNDETLVFETNDGPLAYQTEGDCCSSTWFESITGVEALLGKTVNKEESIDMPEPPSREYKSGHYCDVLQDYGEKLATDGGVADIVYRNSSNGYYGGSIYRIGAPNDLSNFKEITDDWTAS